MATRTCGTNANNSLVAIRWNLDRDTAGVALSAADIAAASIAIDDDGYHQNVGRPPAAPPAAGNPNINWFVPGGMYASLLIPNRGRLIVKPGDVVAWDATTGWPILIGSNAITNGPWTLQNLATNPP
jgi:hypothetical protein